MRKPILSQTFLVLLLAGIVYACMEDELFFPKKDLPPEVSAAKKWYDSQVPEGYLPWRSSNGSETNTYQPDWRTAVSEEDEEWEVTEVHLVGEVGLSFSSSDCMEKYKETKDERYSKLSDTRLLIRTNKETNETDGFIMIVYPDLQYAEAHLNQPLRNFSYLKRNDIAFGGVIHYHTLDGNYLNGWLYREGLPYSFNLDQAIESRSEDELRAYQVCDYVCEYTDHYTDWYVNGEYSWTQWNGRSEECYYTNCRYVESGGGGPSNPPSSVTPTAKLEGPSSIPLMASYGLTVRVTPSTLTITSVKFMIDDSYILQNGVGKTCNLPAKKPGQRRISAVVNGNIYTEEITVDVLFPTATQIHTNGVVYNAIATAWSNAKLAASEEGRSERGFWIYVNTTGNTLVYEVGPTLIGPTVTGCIGTNAEVAPGHPSELPSIGPLDGGKYAVAFFHTHTPLTYCPSESVRSVGPSDNDISYCSTQQIPGLLRDYTGSYIEDEGTVIIGGHNLNLPFQIYTFGPERRATPLF